MARISEFEQTATDNIEVAISASDYSRLGTAADSLNLRVGLYNNAGAEVAHYDLPTAQSSWTLDAQTGEYVYVQAIPSAFNHMGAYQGIALGSTSPAAEVFDAYMISKWGAGDEATVNALAGYSSTITSSSFLPVGTAFEKILQSPAVPSDAPGDATIKWDAPDINTPVVTQDSTSLGVSGSAPPPVCFADGTFVETDKGSVAIEDLKVGDLVRTLDHGLQPLRFIFKRETPSIGNHRPVVFEKGAIGNDRELRVSQRHRMLTTGLMEYFPHDLTRRMLPDTLIWASELINGTTIRLDLTSETVTYFHLMFDRHELIFTHGVVSESWQPHQRNLRRDEELREELLSIFPELNSYDGVDPSQARVEISLNPDRKNARAQKRYANNEF